MAREFEDDRDDDLEAAGEHELDGEDDELSAAAVEEDDDLDEANDDARAAPEMVASDTARDLLRKQLEEDLQRFLAAGGVIEEVPLNHRADLPKQPENNYGRGSL